MKSSLLQVGKAPLIILVLMGLIWNLPTYAQEEPALPPGLAEKPDISEPALPEGLEGIEETGEPALPKGLGEVEETEEPALPEGLEDETQPPAVLEGEGQEGISGFPFGLSGFWEARGGVRTQEDPNEKEFTIGETRLQLEFEKFWEKTTLKLTTDFLFDSVADHHSIQLEEGEGFLDLREANLLFRPAEFIDIKAGRQILTWGTGDLIFINDLFPKDQISFFIGRDPEYLKAPSDAVKISLFTSKVNLDMVYTLRFDSDRFIDGSRLSFFNPQLGRITGRDAVVQVEKPSDWFDDDEIALRLYRNIRGYELALYGYRGFWKSPAGFDPFSRKATFPPLSVYGASIRGVVGRGIGNLEIGYYDSEKDRGGGDPLIRNGEFRFLAGYEQEVAKDLTLGFQYNLEHMLDHDHFVSTLPPGSLAADENRHLLTMRLTKLLLNQNLQLSLFTFYSLSESDTYLRPRIHYKINDHWSAEIGGNIFIGQDDHTFFGQLENNTNVYIGTRYSF